MSQHAEAVDQAVTTSGDAAGEAWQQHECIERRALMFTTKWLNDNRIIAGIFAVLAVLNALAIANGYYR